MENLNKRNIKITKEDINDILKSINIDKEINNINIYQQAFTHKSYVKDNNYAIFNDFIQLKPNIVDFQEKCNERLEFYGDSIICFVSVKYLFDRYPEFDEGILTKLKTNIVSRDYLSKFAKYYNFDKYLLLSNHMENIHGRQIDRLLEDCFEAFVGALSKDLGFYITQDFIIKTIEQCVNFSELLYFNQNYKDRALNYFQMKGWNFPKYEIDCQLGPPTNRTFIVSIIKNYKDENNKWIKEYVCKGYGKTKKDAEQDASLNSLKLYNQLDKYELTLID
jgi:dsRNA-specific ribonuclease